MSYERDPPASEESNRGTGPAGLSRRAYLRATSATAAGFAAVGAGGTAAAESYETITVGAGERYVVDVGDGQTYANKLIDITASGAGVFFDANGNDWEIRDVGVKGAQPEGESLAHFSVPNSGSTGLVENFYAGDGVEGCPSDTVGAWVDATDSDAHRGTLTFRNVNVQGFSDNGIYGSGPAHQLGPDTGGEVIVENSYAKNNNISNFRIGTTGSKITGSVVHVTGSSDVCAHTNGTNARGCWVRDGGSNLLIRNCDIKVPDYNAVEIDSGTSLTIEDSRIEGNIDNDGSLTTSNVSGNPDTTPPDCVPTTPSEAASDTACDGSDGGDGGDGGGGSEPDSGTITFHGGDATSEYRFGAGSDVTGQSNVDSDDDAVYSNATASGSVLGGNDSFDYTGGVTFCNVRGGDATVSIDGTTVNPDDLGQLPNTASIDSTDSNNATDYTLSVSDQLEKSSHNSATIDGDDAIADGTADGSVQGGADSYRFSGEITDFTYSGGSFVLYVNGQQTDPDSVGSGSGTVLDDFEDGDLSEYSGQTSGYGVQGSTTLEGSYTLECTGTYYDIAHASTSTPRGYEYRCQVEAANGSGAEPGLLVSVQDATSPMQDAYWAFADASNGAFKLHRRDGGSTATLDSVSYSFQEATTYEVAVELGSDTVKAVLYDAAGNVVAETATVTDSTYTGGTFGFYTGGGNPAYYDYVTKNSL